MPRKKAVVNKDYTRYAIWAIVAYLVILSAGVITLAISVNALWM